MPLFQSHHDGSAERDESHNVQGRSQASYTSCQHNYSRESRERLNPAKYITDAPIYPPSMHYPVPPYNYKHGSFSEDDYYPPNRYQKLPVRDMLPAQRVPRYPPSQEYYQNTHYPMFHSHENILCGEEDKSHAREEGQPSRMRPRDDKSHDEGIHRKKAKVSENEDQSMIEDAELLATLFTSTEQQKNDIGREDVISSVVPSEVDCQSPIQTKESSSPITHPLSRNREQSPKDDPFQMELKSPRGSADSHFMTQKRFHPSKSYSRFHAGIPGYHVPPNIPFPFERHPMDYGVAASRPQYGQSFPVNPMLPPRLSRESHLPHVPYSDYYHYPPHTANELRETKRPLIILKRKCAWKNCPELEKFLIDNREEYLKHSAMNYTAEQKQYNNKLTERLLEEAKKHGYAFDLVDFNFVAIRDRIRCFYKSYVQNCKKRGIIVGYDEHGNKKCSDKDTNVHNDDISVKSENINDLKAGNPENADPES